MPSIRALFRPALFAASAALALAAVPAIAHHGWSTYDETRPLTLTGKIVESHYENPHAHIRIDAGGKRWLAVLAPVSRMEARGATADKVAVGREVTLVGYASKEKADELRAERITMDGKTVELR
ncbi:hypothetical protein CNE_2c21650 [Cupriavidus necator N-1]|jgi:hypothetical protein|uniref:Uncharacterized protein n=1 Tax=Cupriavidus necator (strain ATCC 43291 / DSM 13513 / CCUG 52238 / LMG 8453 / N-1) TaxID=1042878 RepID=F8GSY7_CUPNN|nr:DUF6152 family protein [Cupriavidus necator]AEI81114.1 hypothetical protein CNE_2c21650 [Cupriavidus necator N-1]KAI3600259.1 hypothetical protein D8I24_4647 [Cupriavidus necator H850]MDX6009266.1 DUF6152 family protein [Cupriavidus necator]